MGKIKPAPIIAGLLILSLCAYGGYLFFLKSSPDVIEASGTIEASQVNVTAKINGTLESIFAAQGEEVEINEVLAILSRPDIELQRERDLLNIELAQAKIRDLRAGARPQELQETQGNLNIAQENLIQAKTNYERLEKLYTNGALSSQELEAAKLKVELAQNQLLIAEAKIELLDLGPRLGTIEAAALELARMESILQATDTLREDLIIKSPLNGTILNSNYEIGEFIAAGAKLFTIANLKDLWLTVYIPSDELSQISLGQEVECFISGDDQAYKGKVVHVADQGEFTPKMIQTKKERANIVFAVKVAITNDNMRLKPGMPADVLFKRGE